MTVATLTYWRPMDAQPLWAWCAEQGVDAILSPGGDVITIRVPAGEHLDIPHAFRQGLSRIETSSSVG